MLENVKSHIDAIMRGESVEQRLSLIEQSNILIYEAKLVQVSFLKSFCLAGALEPLCSSLINLGNGIELYLNNPRKHLVGRELPGVRVDSYGDLVIEGKFYRTGRRCADFNSEGFPLWPLIIRNAPVSGRGPFENFQPQALEILRQAGEQWPR